MTSIDDFITEAIEEVLSWGIPDESLADAIQAEAEFLAGIPAD